MKQAWLDRIRKELKDRQLGDLYWPVEPGILANPFAHRDDFPDEMPGPAADFFSKKNDWEISETIPADDAVAANRLALSALEGGATALDFYFEKTSKPDFDQLLDGVFLEMIGLHFSEPVSPLVGKGSRLTAENFLPQLQKFISAKKLPLENLQGSMFFSGEIPAPAIDFSEETGGHFRTAGFAVEAHLLPTEQLESLLKKAIFFIEKKEKQGIAPEKSACALHFQLPVATDFLVEIAKFRAFRVLWLNIQKAWGFQKLELPVVHAVFSPAAILPGEANANFIRSTTMAMSAIIGGCNRLTVAPAGTDQVFHRRIARNVQHLLKLEAGFDRVQDPAAGSFFSEKLTQQFVEAVWKKLK